VRLNAALLSKKAANKPLFLSPLKPLEGFYIGIIATL
jgi:hypothetical protein